jgi:hypothetical protein
MDAAARRSRVAQTCTQLSGRYKGILEVSKHEGDSKADDTVDFLHRTLRDYLFTLSLLNYFIFADLLCLC